MYVYWLTLSIFFIHLLYSLICIRPRGSMTHQQPKHAQTPPEYLKHMHKHNYMLALSVHIAEALRARTEFALPRRYVPGIHHWSNSSHDSPCSLTINPDKTRNKPKHRPSRDPELWPFNFENSRHIAVLVKTFAWNVKRNWWWIVYDRRVYSESVAHKLRRCFRAILLQWMHASRLIIAQIVTWLP